MPFVERQKKYYKYTTEPNATIIGSPTIVNGVASNFSTSNYFSISKTFNPEDRSWEMVIYVQTGDNITTTQYIIGRNMSGKYTPFLGLSKGKWIINLSSNGTSWNIADGNLVLSAVNPNTKYILKYGWDKNKYYLNVSEDNGVSFINSGNVSSTSIVVSGSLRVGAKMASNSTTTEEPFLGSVDFTQSYIKINDKLWWQGIKSVESAENDFDYVIYNNKHYVFIEKGKHYYKNIYKVNTSIVGSPTINNCVVSGFSGSNYLSFPSLSMSSGSWEIVFKATTGSSTGNNQGLFGITGTGYTRCDTSGNKLRILLSNSSSSFNIGEIASRTLSANTTYWFKITFTGSSYNMYSSLDGINYTLDQSKSSTAKTTFASGMMIGRARDGVWGGSIDLKESYIKISGEVVWDNKFVGTGTPTNYDWSEDKLIYRLPVFLDTFNYVLEQKHSETGTYQFTLKKDFIGKLLFVGNGGGGCSSQKDSQWHYSGGGSGACFEGTVRLPADTYTLTIGSLGYGNNRDNVHYHSSSVVSTDSYLTNSAGEELIRVGAGGNGYTSVGGVSGAAGVLTMGTLDVIETKKARNGNKQVGKTSSTNYSLSAYDDTATGYGAGTGAERGQGNVYGIKGIFKLVINYQDKGMRGY